MRIKTPAARSTDPSSSHEAAEQMEKSGRRQRNIDLVVDFVKTHPGLTSKEIAVAMGNPDIDRYEVARRLADAKGVSLRRGETRPYTACRNMKPCVTWWPIGKINLGVVNG